MELCHFVENATSSDQCPETELNTSGVTKERLKALVQTACELLSAGAPNVDGDQLHRLDKADTKHGVEGIQNLAGIGAPYAMLLYERFLGRPFAGHRDSVSEIIGDSLESAIEDVLSKAGVSRFRAILVKYLRDHMLDHLAKIDLDRV